MVKLALIDIFNGGSYGQRVLSSYLKARNVRIYNILSYNYLQDTKTDLKNILRSIQSLVVDLKPDLVGLSITTTMCHSFYMSLARMIKDSMDVPIIVGGPYPSVSYDFVLKEDCIDYVCVGEGEESLAELCTTFGSKNKPGEIPGIISKINPTLIPRDPPQDLDSLPFQDVGSNDTYSISGRGIIIKNDNLLKDTVYSTKFSRGCIFNCTFCINHALRNSYSSKCKYYRVRSVQHVIRELCEQKNRNAKMKEILVLDDTLPVIGNWLNEFSELYRNKINLPFTIWINPNTLNENRIRLLKDARCRMFTMGIQSSSEKTRSSIFDRHETNEQLVKIDHLISKYGISKQYEFMVDHPWENKFELSGIFNLTMMFKKPYLLNMHSLMFFEGTKLEQRAVREGIIDRDENRKDLINNPFAVSRKIRWVRGHPHGQDAQKNYWINSMYLLSKGYLCLPNSFIKIIFCDILPSNAITIFMFNSLCCFLKILKNFNLRITGR